MADVLNRLVGNQRALGEVVIDGGYRSVAECWWHATTCDELHFPLLNARLRKVLTTLHDNERALVERTGSTLCGCHKEEHEALLTVCREAQDLETCNWRRARSLLRYQFRKLFREHMICMDSVTVLFIRTSLASSQLAGNA